MERVYPRAFDELIAGINASDIAISSLWKIVTHLRDEDLPGVELDIDMNDQNEEEKHILLYWNKEDVGIYLHIPMDGLYCYIDKITSYDKSTYHDENENIYIDDVIIYLLENFNGINKN